MLGSSSLTEGNDGEKVALPLISRGEPQGSNTLTNERCLCNTRLSCIMTDVYFSDKGLSNTSSHPSVHLLTCSTATRESQQEHNTRLVSTASCCLNAQMCCPVKALKSSSARWHQESSRQPPLYTTYSTCRSSASSTGSPSTPAVQLSPGTQ